MKRAYEAPKLTNHGSVNTVTQISNDSTRRDTLFGPNGSTASTAQGSLDACIILPGTTTCL